MIEELYDRFCECGCRITTDSRAISGGEMFIALKGENFDGNAFAGKAIGSGAAYVVVNKDAAIADSAQVIRVPDTQRALSDLAAYHRNHACSSGRLPVIGLTGTNGKTTTKELVSAVLRRKFNVCATEGNLNNDIGVPLSLLKIRPETQIAVIEMGASHPDDIEKLVRVSQPDYGLITNVGKAHLLGFGSFEGVKKAKGALYRWLGAHSGSLIFLNEDDDDLRRMAGLEPCHIFGYGLKYSGAEILPVTSEYPFLRMRLSDGTVVKTQLVGGYNAANVMAALCVGEYFGVAKADAIAAVESYEPRNKRSQMTRTALNTVIVDAYNANPSSMAAALDNFAAVKADSKLALLGDMRELGADSRQEHLRIVEKLDALGIEAFLVGEEFAGALSVYGGSAAFRSFASSSDLAGYLLEHPVSGRTILLKGSRGIEMEKVLPSL